MTQIPDAPWIQEAERLGYPPYDTVKCPICGEECDTIYIDNAGDACGCENCVGARDSYDWYQDELERMRPE